MFAVQIEREILTEMVTNTGKSVWDHSFETPIMLVFLRHFGCTFCREALADIARTRADIESMGTRLLFVHMTDNDTADRYFVRYDLPDAIHISDPECKFYTAFGLMKGNFTQLFGLQTWIRGFQAGVLDGHGIGPQLGDGFQMPGVFVLQDGLIKDAFIHKLSSERPDYVTLARHCCEINPQ